MSPREGSQDVVLMVEVVDGVEASLSLSRSSLSLLLPEGHHRWRGVTVVKAVKALLMRFSRCCCHVKKEVHHRCQGGPAISIFLVIVIAEHRLCRAQSLLPIVVVVKVFIVVVERCHRLQGNIKAFVVVLEHRCCC